MKFLRLFEIGLALAMALTDQAVGQTSGASQPRFNFELHTALSGALYGATNGNSHAKDLVYSVFVDSKDNVFAGSRYGLALYDGNRWTNWSFKTRSHRTLLGRFGSAECGPERIAEGPAGTMWFGGSACGVWRFQSGRLVEITASPVGSYLGMAVDQSGSVWVVTRDSVQRFDGKIWTEVLSPYVAGKVHRELPQLFGIAIEESGNVWIGGTVYGEQNAPWEHPSAVWTVDQQRRKRGSGPPMSGLYRFDGSGWRAFGSPHGFVVQTRDTAIPELDGRGRIVIKTRRGYLAPDGESWKSVSESEIAIGKRWVLRGRKDSVPTGYYAELLFQNHETVVPVMPTSTQSGEVLDIGQEPLSVLRLADDPVRDCVWMGTMHGLYRIWRTDDAKR